MTRDICLYATDCNLTWNPTNTSTTATALVRPWNYHVQPSYRAIDIRTLVPTDLPQYGTFPIETIGLASPGGKGLLCGTQSADRLHEDNWSSVAERGSL